MMTKILIVDDEAAHRTLLATVFRDPAKYEFLEAKNGEEAVRFARDFQPDIILMDVVMQGMDDGLVALERLKANGLTVHIPVVLISAINCAEHIKRGEELGAAGWLSKPFDVMTIEAKVRAWAGKA